MIKQVCGLLDLFVTKITNVYFLQIIKLNREALVKYVYYSFSHLLIVFFSDRGRHFEYDVSRELVVTYIVTPIFVQSQLSLIIHILCLKPFIIFPKMEILFFYY